MKESGFMMNRRGSLASRSTDNNADITFVSIAAVLVVVAVIALAATAYLLSRCYTMHSKIATMESRLSHQRSSVLSSGKRDLEAAGPTSPNTTVVGGEALSPSTQKRPTSMQKFAREVKRRTMMFNKALPPMPTQEMVYVSSRTQEHPVPIIMHRSNPSSVSTSSIRNSTPHHLTLSRSSLGSTNQAVLLRNKGPNGAKPVFSPPSERTSDPVPSTVVSDSCELAYVLQYSPQLVGPLERDIHALESTRPILKNQRSATFSLRSSSRPPSVAPSLPPTAPLPPIPASVSLRALPEVPRVRAPTMPLAIREKERMPSVSPAPPVTRQADQRLPSSSSQLDFDVNDYCEFSPVSPDAAQSGVIDGEPWRPSFVRASLFSINQKLRPKAGLSSKMEV